MIACGIAQWAADISIGHKPDSYDKVQQLFPTHYRSEYAKCSKLINVFSKIASLVQSDDAPKDIVEQLDESFEKKFENYKKTTDTKIADLQRQHREDVTSPITDDAINKRIEEILKKHKEENDSK